jgi:hypothetical protein
VPPCVVVFLTTVRVFRCGSSRVSLQLFVHLVTALRVFGRPSCQLAFHCVWVPLLPTRLALPLVRLLVRFVTSFRAFGHPSCELALPCIRAPNLGEAVLKNLPPSQNWFLSVIRLVFFPSALLCVVFVAALRAFRYGRSCVWVPILPIGLALHLGAPLANSTCLALGRPTLARLLVCFVTALRAFGRPCCKLALRCLVLPCVDVFVADRFFVWAPILRTCLALRWGAQPW